MTTQEITALRTEALEAFAADRDRAKYDSAMSAIDAMIAEDARAEGKREGRKAGPCPITEAEFAAHHPKLNLTVFGKTVKVVPKYGDPRPNKTGDESGGRFSSGSFGYWIGGRVDVEINGKIVPFQLTGNLVAVNSK